MKISKATTNDIPELCGLLTILFTQEEEFKPDFKKQAEGLRNIIENPSAGCILKAEADGRIIGMVNLLFTISTFTGGKVAVLEDMVVLPEQRGTGTGAKILEAAKNTAKEEGCRRITLLTDGNNLLAQKFYKKHGFERSDMVAMRYFY
ncbi:GCN5-related N-acetyltransferase [Denitrovibrio acetiphilus DSM 12809]|uniref:GCN5-related N-acetyltransferase n=1 Tax=Denitrovibrio acetiphilus (strain DSM 12809 / NBRC 114555 / N2460) TaxID=522772 RepID=D4H4E1_DENA2|nr:GNAT family N-acetyltransferase [Denitrovibrio acetiphilus]ADD69270.1 GCN5-related N-acetyltransferase [Denitrovibrio acetiphilus DSM 12809]